MGSRRCRPRCRQRPVPARDVAWAQYLAIQARDDLAAAAKAAAATCFGPMVVGVSRAGPDRTHPAIVVLVLLVGLLPLLGYTVAGAVTGAAALLLCAAALAVAGVVWVAIVGMVRGYRPYRPDADVGPGPAVRAPGAMR